MCKLNIIKNNRGNDLIGLIDCNKESAKLYFHEILKHNLIQHKGIEEFLNSSLFDQLKILRLSMERQFHVYGHNEILVNIVCKYMECMMACVQLTLMCNNPGSVTEAQMPHKCVYEEMINIYNSQKVEVIEQCNWTIKRNKEKTTGNKKRIIVHSKHRKENFFSKVDEYVRLHNTDMTICVKKPKIIYEEDWLCKGCFNINFNFRNYCYYCDWNKLRDYDLIKM